MTTQADVEVRVTPAWRYWSLALFGSILASGALIWLGFGGDRGPLGRILYELSGGTLGGLLACRFIRRRRRRRSRQAASGGSGRGTA